MTARIGRPSKITAVHHVGADGKPVTVGEVIVQTVRQGEYVETACGAARVNKFTYYEWVKVSKVADAKARRHEHLTPHEVECLAFSNAIAEAIDLSEVEVGQRILAAGMQPVVKDITTTKRVPVAMPDGSVTYHDQVETRHEVGPPNLAALLWRQERRFSKRWGQKGSLEVTGPDGGPVQVEVSDAERAAALIAEIQAYRQGIADASPANVTDNATSR